MPIGLDELSAISSFVSLSIQVLNGCVKGFELLCRAKRCEKHVATLQLLIRFQKLKLLNWANVVGLLATPPELHINIVHVELIVRTLTRLNDLLNDIRTLAQYGLNVEQTAEVITEICDDTELNTLESARASDVQVPIGATRSVFRQRTSPWQRLKWVAVDEKRFKELLSDISCLVNELHGLLTPNQVRELSSQHISVLRNAVINTSDPRSLELLANSMRTVQEECSVAATAQLKKRNILLDIRDFLRCGGSGEKTGSRPGSIDSISTIQMEEFQLDAKEIVPPKSLCLSSKQLRKLEKPAVCGHRELLYYGRKPVLIEWRSVDEPTWKLLKDRIDNLTSLLSSMNDRSFHSLPCLGYLTINERGRFGTVFGLPDMASSPLGSSLSQKAEYSKSVTLPKVRTLHDLMSSSGPAPSLNVRVRCAITIFETVLQLHTADWLHKGLRSDNLVFFQRESENVDQDSVVSSDMYIGGYDYARADKPWEYTEPARSKIEVELYRHPASLGSVRQLYHKSFDIFSIGCIMLELGFWSTFADILLKHFKRSGKPDDASAGHSTDQQATHVQSPEHKSGGNVSARSSSLDLLLLREDFIKETGMTPGKRRPLFEALEAQTGKTYARIVIDCLTMESNQASRQTDSGSNEQISALLLEQKSLERLRKLAAVL